MTILAVLGNKLRAHNVLPGIVRCRLQTCMRLYQQGDLVIVCGGNVCGSRCSHTEAYVMRQYLLEHSQIPKDRILLENRSMDTISNIRNLKKMLHKRLSSVVVITSAWHMPRVKWICKAQFGARKIRFVSSPDTVSPHRMKLEKKYLAQLKSQDQIQG